MSDLDECLPPKDHIRGLYLMTWQDPVGDEWMRGPNDCLPLEDLLEAGTSGHGKSQLVTSGRLVNQVDR